MKLSKNTRIYGIEKYVELRIDEGSVSLTLGSKLGMMLTVSPFMARAAYVSQRLRTLEM
jgi:hypothetical protein